MSHPTSLAASWSPVLAGGDDPLSHVLPHELTFSWAKFGDYTLTNHLFMLVVSALLLLIVMPLAARSRGLVPKGFSNLIEAVLQYLREDMVRPVLGELTDKFIPFIWTMFFLILTSNLLGMIPLGAFAAPIDVHLKHIGGTATGNLSITAGLAICSFILIHVTGLKVQGPANYGKTFLGHAPVWLAPLMVPLEVVAAIVKPFALAIRLFANMIAGHVVIAVLLGFAIYGLSQVGPGLGLTIALPSALGVVFISLLELLVAFLQAYIFTFLSTLFIGMAIEH